MYTDFKHYMGRWAPLLTVVALVTFAVTSTRPGASQTTTNVTTTQLPAAPSIELLTGDSKIEAIRLIGDEAYVSLPVYLGSMGAALQFDLTRDGYDQPTELSARQISAEGTRTLSIPEGLEFDWSGFPGFFEVSVRNADDEAVLSNELAFCPNGTAQRIDATGPDRNPYPADCSGQLLSLGSVWGIAQGWASSAGYEGVRIPSDVPAGTYTVEVAVTEPYAAWLGDVQPVLLQLRLEDVDPKQLALDVGDNDGDGILNYQDPTYNVDWDRDGIDDSTDPLIDIDADGIADDTDPEVDMNGDGLHDFYGLPNGTLPSDINTDEDDDTPELPHKHTGRPSTSVTHPDRSSLPDLQALPAFSITTSNDGKHDLLNFSAVTWNAGKAPMVIDGYRSASDRDLMDAYQTFYSDGEAVGSAPIGSLEYHRGGGHDHWHFQDFLRYELVSNADKSYMSGKQAWCLSNNYAVDLTLPGVEWSMQQESLETSCGDEGALWVREVLAVGWGDLYSQSVSGQSFDVSNLPNGLYRIRITANPEGALYETSSRNNVSERVVRLGGVRGARTVRVPPYRGVDTESALKDSTGAGPDSVTPAAPSTTSERGSGSTTTTTPKARAAQGR